MKLFDLEAAKRGEAICYANGEPAKFECITSTGRIITTAPDGEPWQHDLSGKSRIGRHLFMAPRKREGWIALAPSGVYLAHATPVFPSSEQAMAHGKTQFAGTFATVRIEWPE